MTIHCTEDQVTSLEKFAYGNFILFKIIIFLWVRVCQHLLKTFCSILTCKNNKLCDMVVHCGVRALQSLVRSCYQGLEKWITKQGGCYFLPVLLIFKLNVLLPQQTDWAVYQYYVTLEHCCQSTKYRNIFCLENAKQALKFPHRFMNSEHNTCLLCPIYSSLL